MKVEVAVLGSLLLIVLIGLYGRRETLEEEDYNKSGTESACRLLVKWIGEEAGGVAGLYVPLVKGRRRGGGGGGRGGRGGGRGGQGVTSGWFPSRTFWQGRL